MDIRYDDSLVEASLLSEVLCFLDHRFLVKSPYLLPVPIDHPNVCCILT